MAARHDVVLVPFPFTDLSTVHVRPAVVVSMDDFTIHSGDVIVAMITSQPHSLPTDYALEDWNAAGLLYPSWMRAKVATLDQRLIRRVIGKLSDGDAAAVMARLRSAFGF